MITVKSKKIKNVLKIGIPYLLIPALAVAASSVVLQKKHLAVSFAVAALSFLLFISGFEKQRSGTVRLVLSSIMAAFCIVGRFIPYFKPISALTAIGGMWLGGTSGFLVGSISALISNFWFGQGPWTPFQMLAWGLVGLFAGYLSKYLKKSRTLLLVYGALSGAFFSFVMDVWTVLWYNGTFDLSLYKGAIVSAAPFTILYSVSNVVFLFLLAKPFGEKFARIELKYGLD